jgi:ADP-ribosylation factor GTPase-activating protein 2/3
LGVHVSFVRSTTLDTWSEDQLRLMAVGGNHRARQFFKQHGWGDDAGGSDKIEARYTSRAAQQYRAQLERDARQFGAGGVASAASGGIDDFGASPPTTTTTTTTTARPSAAALPAGAAAAGVGAAGRAASHVGAASRKPAISRLGGGGGLGVRKLATKVDDSVFDQPPAPPPAAHAAEEEPAADDGADGGFGGGAPGTSSRFAYDALHSNPAPAESAPAPAVMRGKDGHLVIGGGGGGGFGGGGGGGGQGGPGRGGGGGFGGNDDFFRDPFGTGAGAAGGSGGGMGGGAPRPGGGAGGGGNKGAVYGRSVVTPAGGATGSSSYAGPDVAQQRFGNAKAISSADFENPRASGADDYERQAQIGRFTGAAAISSDAYFNRGGGGGGRAGGGGGGMGGGGMGGGGGGGGGLDVTAGELASRLAYQAQQDMAQARDLAERAISGAVNSLSRLMNDLM